MNRSARVLFAMFQGGGNIPLIMPVAARLAARGHQVRIMAGPGVRHSRLPVSTSFLQRIRTAGATLVPSVLLSTTRGRRHGIFPGRQMTPAPWCSLA